MMLWRAPYSRQTDARIDESIRYVGEETGDDVDERDQQHDNLHDQKVARLDRLDGKLADAGPGEYCLDDDGAGEQIADLDCRDGNDRDCRIAQDVTPDDACERQAACATCSDVVFAKLVDDRA